MQKLESTIIFIVGEYGMCMKKVHASKVLARLYRSETMTERSGKISEDNTASKTESAFVEKINQGLRDRGKKASQLYNI